VVVPNPPGSKSPPLLILSKRYGPTERPEAWHCFGPVPAQLSPLRIVSVSARGPMGKATDFVFGR
jgi:hypothetical protein